jgi:DNA replication protein DnaC
MVGITEILRSDARLTGAFIARHEDGLFLGLPGTGKVILPRPSRTAIQQGYRVLYRETHKLLDDLAEATIDGTRKQHMGRFCPDHRWPVLG